jgi:uncharacterized membrane protein YhaH (DUF805 family)
VNYHAAGPIILDFKGLEDGRGSILTGRAGLDAFDDWEFLMDAYLAAMRNYATFSGRAGRKEYWMFALIVMAIMIVCFILDPMLGIYVLQGVFKTSSSAELNGAVVAAQAHDGIGILTLIAYLVHLIPGSAVAFRRLHDVNKSGWSILLAVIPLVNFYFLFLLIEQGTPGINRFGAPPPGPLPPPVPVGA